MTLQPTNPFDPAKLYDLPPQNKYRDSVSEDLIAQILMQRRKSGTVLVAAAAIDDGATVEWIHPALATARIGRRQILISAHRGPESPVGNTIVRDKMLTKEFLQASGVATPRGKVVRNAPQAVDFQAELDLPIVLKPRFGNTGSGVSVNLTDPHQIEEAFSKARLHGQVIAEEFINTAQEFRCIASERRCFSVTERLLPFVIGDGESTINELIDNKNRNRSATLFYRPIPVDDATERTLESQNYTLGSVLGPGTRIFVRDVGGYSSGGEPYERTLEASASVKDIAASATGAIPGLLWSGSDVIIAPDGTPHVIEINTNADISGASFPIYGEPSGVRADLWHALKEHATTEEPSKLQAPVIRKRLLPKTASAITGQRNTRLDELFENYLIDSSYQMQTYPGRLRKVAIEGQHRWFQTLFTTRDRAISTRLLRRHALGRSYLQHQDYQVPDAYRRVSPRKFELLTSNTSQVWARVSTTRPWPGRENLELENIGSAMSTSNSAPVGHIVQNCPEGHLFRVLTTRNGTVVVLSPEKAVRHLSDTASRTAVAALREIPGLSFASVDVLITGTSKHAETVMIEGLSDNPLIHPEWWILRGSFTDLWEAILEPLKSRDY